MRTSVATKPLLRMSSGHKSEMIVVFYLITFLTGGFFLFFGGRLGFVVDFTATVSYIAVTVLFYSLSEGA